MEITGYSKRALSVHDYALDSQSFVMGIPMMIVLGQLFYCVILFDDY